MLLQVLNALREVSFFTETGEKVFFDKNGDPAARYDLLNWQQGEDGTTKFVKVGFYDASLQPEFQLSFNNISIVWAKNQHQVLFFFSFFFFFYFFCEHAYRFEVSYIAVNKNQALL